MLKKVIKGSMMNIAGPSAITSFYEGLLTRREYARTHRDVFIFDREAFCASARKLGKQPILSLTDSRAL
jgi:hypothetical protein